MWSTWRQQISWGLNLEDEYPTSTQRPATMKNGSRKEMRTFKE